MKHTSGPWEVIRPPYRKGLSNALLERNPDAILIVSRSTMWAFGVSIAALSESKEGEVNARLIAVAPEMLEALQASESLLKRLRACNRDFVQEIDEVCEQAHTAIARTRGERK